LVAVSAVDHQRIAGGGNKPAAIRHARNCSFLLSIDGELHGTGAYRHFYVNHLNIRRIFAFDLPIRKIMK
jgi:hypothetical protein